MGFKAARPRQFLGSTSSNNLSEPLILRTLAHQGTTKLNFWKTRNIKRNPLSQNRICVMKQSSIQPIRRSCHGAIFVLRNNVLRASAHHPCDDVATRRHDDERRAAAPTPTVRRRPTALCALPASLHHARRAFPLWLPRARLQEPQRTVPRGARRVRRALRVLRAQGVGDAKYA